MFKNSKYCVEEMRCSQGGDFRFRLYKNAFETQAITKDDQDQLCGFSDLIRLDTFLFGLIKEMIKNIDNYRGKKIAKMFAYFNKKSLRFLSEKVLNGEFKFEYHDRSL